MFLRINLYLIFHCWFFYLKRDNILVEIIKFVFQPKYYLFLNKKTKNDILDTN